MLSSHNFNRAEFEHTDILLELATHLLHWMSRKNTLRGLLKVKVEIVLIANTDINNE